MCLHLGGDMPHLIKKIVNCLERIGVLKTTNLEWDNAMMSLKMLQDIWEQDSGRMGDIRTNILTLDHFLKNSYSRMRVHLAVQVMSNSMACLIKSHAEACGGQEKYKSILRIIERVDR